MLSRSYQLYPPTSHVYIVNLGLICVFIFSYFCSLTHRLWVLTEAVRVPTIYVLSKIVIFTAVDNQSLIHMWVCYHNSSTDVRFNPKPKSLTFTTDWVNWFAVVFVFFTNSEEESLTSTAENHKTKEHSKY